MDLNKKYRLVENEDGSCDGCCFDTGNRAFCKRANNIDEVKLIEEVGSCFGDGHYEKIKPRYLVQDDYGRCAIREFKRFDDCGWLVDTCGESWKHFTKIEEKE